jgi:hypothetical protein
VRDTKRKRLEVEIRERRGWCVKSSRREFELRRSSLHVHL